MTFLQHPPSSQPSSRSSKHQVGKVLLLHVLLHNASIDAKAFLSKISPQKRKMDCFQKIVVHFASATSVAREVGARVKLVLKRLWQRARLLRLWERQGEMRHLEVNIGGSADYSNIVVVGEVRHGNEAKKLSLLLLALAVLLSATLVHQAHLRLTAPNTEEGEHQTPPSQRFVLRIGVSPWSVHFSDQALEESRQFHCLQLAREVPQYLQGGLESRFGSWIAVETLPAPLSSNSSNPTGEHEAVLFGAVECSTRRVTLAVQLRISERLLDWMPELAERIQAGILDHSAEFQQNANLETALAPVISHTFSGLVLTFALKINAELNEGAALNVLQDFQPLLQALEKSDSQEHDALATYVLGKLYRQLALDSCGQVDTILLDRAKAYFDRARQNQNWAAPIFEQGLIAHYHLLVTRSSFAKAQGFAIESERLMSQALQQLEEPYRSLAQAQAHLISARNRFLLFSMNADELWGATLDNAETLLDSALAQLESQSRQTALITELRAQAYLLKGDIFAARQSPQAARKAYEQAYALAIHPRTREQAGGQLAHSWVISHNACEAAALYAELARSSCQKHAARYARQAQLLAYQCRAEHDARTR